MRNFILSYDPLSIARALIRCQSVTPADDGAIALIGSLLAPLGFTLHMLPFEGNGSYRVENLFARKGTGGPHLCFAGHTDVVPAGEETAWSVPPFDGAVVDGKLIGRGASDMKGQIAAFIAAIARFVEKTSHSQGSISLLITGDEEKDSVNGTVRVLEWMRENGQIPDVCLVGEPSNPSAMGDALKIGRRGSLSGQVTIHGKQGHVAYPEKADNPIPRLMRIIETLQNTCYDEGSAFFAPTHFEATSFDVGNPSFNVIPQKASARFNLRFSDFWTIETLSQKVREIILAEAPEAEIMLRSNSESFLTSPGEWTHLVAQAVETITGKKPEFSTSGGTSDARFFARYCPVVEFGMVNATIHKTDEYCTLDELAQCTGVYEEILIRYFGK